MDFRRTGRDESFDRARAAIDEAMAQLRGEIFELHPYVLDHAGLQAALRAIAERSAERMGAEFTVVVDPLAAGLHDELLVVLARELIANVVKHSGAARVVGLGRGRLGADRARGARRRPRVRPGRAPRDRAARRAHRARVERAACPLAGRRAGRREPAGRRDGGPVTLPLPVDRMTAASSGWAAG